MVTILVIAGLALAAADLVFYRTEGWCLLIGTVLLILALIIHYTVG